MSWNRERSLAGCIFSAGSRAKDRAIDRVTSQSRHSPHVEGHAFRRVLPRRRCSRANADGASLPYRDSDERRSNFHCGRAQSVNYSEYERRRDVPRSEVDDSDKRRSGANGGTAEGEVVRDHDAALAGCTFENCYIRATNKLFFPSRAQIASPRSEACHDARTNILV